MKLFYRVFLHLSLGIIGVLTLWAVFFYVAMKNEINDEVDDSLEDYSELIIMRSLAGEKLPSHDSGTNNQYHINEVSKEYVDSHSSICYRDSMVYIEAKKETEPARILTTIFKDRQDKYYELEVSVPTIEKSDLRQTILIMIAGLYFVMLLAFLIIHIWVFRRSMKPFYRLLSWLNVNRLGDKCQPLNNPTDIIEFQQLNEAVRTYAAYSETVYEQQKLFIGQASHELQTPLAICYNRIEMLIEETDPTERQMVEMVKILQTLEHMTKLNKSLLLLSKIENHQFTEQSAVHINEILHRFMNDYKDVYGYLDITLKIEEQGSFVISMNDTLAVVLVTNLIKNAYVHNYEHGTISIYIDKDSFRVGNTGEEKPLDNLKIFQRFYQGKKKEGSTGLGLALVFSICRLSKLNIHYSYIQNEHLFSITRL